MKIKMVTSGLINNPEIEWPEGWPPPAVGDSIQAFGNKMYVWYRTWYPAAVDNQEPYVYIVLGPRP